jgi:hypothetical protein
VNEGIVLDVELHPGKLTAEDLVYPLQVSVGGGFLSEIGRKWLRAENLQNDEGGREGKDNRFV